MKNRFDPEVSDVHQLRRLLLFSRKYVSGLRITQLPSHIDLGTVLCQICQIGQNFTSFLSHSLQKAITYNHYICSLARNNPV